MCSLLMAGDFPAVSQDPLVLLSSACHFSLDPWGGRQWVQVMDMPWTSGGR